MNSRSMRPLLLGVSLMAALALTTAGALAAVDEPPPSPLTVEMQTNPDYLELFEAELDAVSKEAERYADAMVLAHNGQLSQKDDCHKSKAEGRRHYHAADTVEAAGTCWKESGIRYRVPDVEPVRKLGADCVEWLDWLVDGNGDAETYFGNDRNIKVRVKALDKGARVCLGRAPVRE